MIRLRRSVIAAIAAITMLTTVAALPASSTESAAPPLTNAVTTEGIDLDNSTAGQLKRLYATIFARPADSAGQNYWLGVLADGAEYDDVAWAFINSDEWQARFADVQTDQEFVELLYVQALGRDADAEGLAYWLDVLDQGFSRTDLIPFFAESQEQRNNTETKEDFGLTIAHINDHHSHLEADGATLTLAGADTDVDVGGFPRVVTKINEIESRVGEGEAFAKIHAGDAITGTLFFSLFKGEADAALMNEACFDVFALGNHEFDEGDEGLVTFLDFLNASSECETDTIAANVVPAEGTPLNNGVDYIKPFVVKQYDGSEVGYIGIDIAAKTKNSSSPLPTTEFLDEVATTQLYIDELTAQGIDKIVLVSHYQYGNDVALASQVRGLDAIVGGDSHTLLGDFDKYGLSPGGTYPTITNDGLGLPVCVVQAWEYSLVVGELRVGFDELGQVTSCEGVPHLLLGDSFERDDAEGESQAVEGEDLAAIMAEIEAAPELSIVEPDPASEAALAGFAEQVDELAQEVIGTVTEDLCLERIPGQGRSNIAGCTEKTAQNGGDIQQLVAQAFLNQSFEADISLQNAGGVRVDVPAGDFTIADAYTVLPFANTLVNMEMTGTEIRQSLEEGLDNAVQPDGSTGAYPYTAGLRFDVDLTQAFGSRVSNLEYKAKGTDTWVAFDESGTYTVVTNDFLSGGRDGYTTLGVVTDSGRTTDTFLDYAKSFIDYVEKDANGVLTKLDVSDYSTQNFIPLPD